MSFFCSRNASIQKAVVVLAMIELRRYLIPDDRYT